MSNSPGLLAVLLVAWASAFCAGCQDEPMSLAGDKRLAAFEAAGQGPLELDLEKLSAAPPPRGNYRVVPGDVLELQLPAMAAGTASPASTRVEACLSRVGADGAILLPVAGAVSVSGKTATQIESAVAEAYHPKYLTARPTVVVKVAEHASIRVSVVGAVRSPGLYELHSDEQSLLLALTKAGGVVPEGADQVQVRRAGGKGLQVVALPVKGVNVPMSDMALADGDFVEVQRTETPAITVLGLVNKPGVFPCRSGEKFTMVQALAMAGGTNELAAPDCATVYRRDAAGNAVSAVFRIAGKESSQVILKPGDVVAVEPTLATQTRLAVLQLLRFGLGANATYSLTD